MDHADRRKSTASEEKRRAIKRETARLFAKYAVTSLVPVLALGAILSAQRPDHLYLGLAIGLTALYLALLALTTSVRLRLHRQRAVNARQAEQMLAAELQYRLLFEHNPQPMLAYARDTLAIVAVSNAMVARYGYTREELLTMTIRDLAPLEDLDELDSYVATAGKGERRGLVSRPWRHRYKDGTIIDAEITSDDCELDGRACRIVLSQDVTERNAAIAALAGARDQAVEASKVKSAFLANVSHEIRTPMNGVIGMNELLLDTALDVQQRTYAEQVARSGEQMMTVINDILDLSKIEAGRFELDITDFDLRDTIELTCAAGRPQAIAKGLAIDLTLGADVPVRARGDSTRIRQVLGNLVANAVKFTAQGSIVVRGDCASRPDGAIALRLQVTDTGIGIAPQTLERLFQPFEQADASTTRNYGGTGLGLAIARELTERMGGTIGAASEPDVGSTFWFELELGAAAAAPVLRAVALPAGIAPAGSRLPLVLVAEDNRVNQIVAVATLQRLGCAVQVVGDGAAALAALAGGHFDAVLMDCQMPGMDGFSATEELRRRERARGERRHTPVIAMTASAMKGDVERCLAVGMDDHVSKPVRFEVLAETLRRWLPEAGEGLDHAA
ncbi:MAG: ATP-binding protein [Solirubrobacteraceae bacterium]|jgi:PAS domain S-box-containing protein